MKTRARASIQYEGFGRSESEKLKPFLFISHHFAKLWGKNVVLDAPHGAEVSYDTDDQQNAIHIHFFSAPIGAANKRTEYLSHVFHFELSARGLTIEHEEGSSPRVSSGDDVAAFLSVPLLYFDGEGKSIYSVEGHRIAGVFGNHIDQ